MVQKKASLFVPDGSTALQVLQHGSKKYKCFKHESSGSDEHITQICGKKNDYEKKTYWELHINDKLTYQAAKRVKVKDGDVIEFRYSRLYPFTDL